MIGLCAFFKNLIKSRNKLKEFKPHKSLQLYFTLGCSLSSNNFLRKSDHDKKGAQKQHVTVCSIVSFTVSNDVCTHQHLKLFINIKKILLVLIASQGRERYVRLALMRVLAYNTIHSRHVLLRFCSLPQGINDFPFYVRIGGAVVVVDFLSTIQLSIISVFSNFNSLCSYLFDEWSRHIFYFLCIFWKQVDSIQIRH